MNKIRFRYGKAIGTIKHETENRVNRLGSLVERMDNMHDQMVNYKKEHNENARNETHSNTGGECFH